MNISIRPEKSRRSERRRETRGSLGNITAGDDKVAVVNFEDKCVKLIGPYSIIGRSINY